MAKTLTFTPREIKQIEFSLIYARDFNHGADGHNNMSIVAKLATDKGFALKETARGEELYVPDTVTVEDAKKVA